MEVRQAILDDLPEITSIFRDTVRHINAKDYSEQQIDLWSSGANNIEKWEDRIHNFYFIVAQIKGIIVGFAYLKNGNYFDGLFVHKNYQRQSIASKLMRSIESKVIMNGYDTISSDVSITALPLFKAYDYVVVKKQKKNFKGLVFENYIVKKQL